MTSKPVRQARTRTRSTRSPTQRAERYWQLLAVMNGWPVRPATAPAFQWLLVVL
jgi:hypothetical protein